LFVVTQLLVSCSADNEILSQFSKRKYLKKYKSENVKYEDKIEGRSNELAFNEETSQVFTASSDENSITQIIDDEVKEIKKEEPVAEVLPEIKEIRMDYSNWNSYNRDFSRLPIASEKLEFKHNSLKKGASMTDLQLVLAILFLLIVPPLSVLFSNPDKFVLNLIIYLAGLGLWVAGVTATSGAMVGVGSLLVFVSFIHALVVLIKSA